MNINDKAVLLTGGSRGLGQALAHSFSEAGARVVLVARGEERLDVLVRTIRANGGEAHGIAEDVGEVDRATEIVGRATALVGAIDIVVHNASTLGPVPMPVLLDTEVEDLVRVFAVNAFGPFALTRAIAGSMLVRGGGTVVHISSDAAVEAYPRWGAYGASKAALDHVNRTWAAEFTDTPVRFLSIDPGEMDTQMHSQAMPEADPAQLARPEDVATRIMAILRSGDGAPSGARLRASEWGV